jgi:N-acetylneuraminic acid mutarotase
MRKIYSLLFLISLTNMFSQDWTWMHGPNIINTWGKYGSLGVSSPTVVPGSRHGCSTWTDASGNLWLFGGEGLGASGSSGWLNDLWKYNTVTNEWTWIMGDSVKNKPGSYGVKGLASSSNIPGAREFTESWKDASGNFWLFGGDGYDAFSNFGNLNDLWKFDPITMQWTWFSGSNLSDQNGVYGIMGVSSPANSPGGRWSPVVWTDASGNFWMFGGEGFPASGTNGELNDLWKFNPSTGEWTWMSGSNLILQNGTYGTKGVGSTANIPGGRKYASRWKDASGNLWLMGGEGFPASGAAGYLNDLWKYSISSNQWTWIHGSNTANPTANYGSLGVAAASNVPGGRYSHVEWQDTLGNFWMFAGLGFGSTSTIGRLNDVWKYNPITNVWTWMKGFPVTDQYGIYGTLGVTTPVNTPGARYYSDGWTQPGGIVWIFGGFSFPVSGAPGNMNDLWKLTPSCSPENMTLIPELSICENDSAILSATTSGTGTISWYSSPSSTTAIASGTSISTPTLSAGAYTYFAEVSTCTTSPRTEIVINVSAYPSVTVNTSASLICAGQAATLTASGASSYTWNTAANGFSIAVSPTTTTNYWVMAENGGCADTAYISQGVSPCTSIQEYHSDHSHLLYPNPNNGTFSFFSSNNAQVLIIYNGLLQEIFKQTLNAGENKIELKDLQKGVYYFKLNEVGDTISSGKILIQ